MGDWKSIKDANLEVSRVVAKTYPVADEKKYALFFESVFGEFCMSILKRNEKEIKEKLADLLKINNALYIRVTGNNYSFIEEKLDSCLATASDEYEASQEILVRFIDFYNHITKDEDEKMHLDPKNSKKANFVFSAIFGFSEKFLDGSLALCLEAKELAEREIVNL